jgi:hypothetical protein
MDMAVVVNVRARRGSSRVASTLRELLPGAEVWESHSLDDADGLAERLISARPALVVSGGGDGTAVALLNSIHRATTKSPSHGVRCNLLSRSTIGLLPLGTGNGWANVTGAPPWKRAAARLGSLRGESPLPSLRFDLVSVDGTLAPFAGTGWDAEIIEDFHAQKSGPGLLPKGVRGGVLGYLHGMFLRTIPRHLRTSQVEVEIVNTGDDALTIDERGQAVAVPAGRAGAVLYRGPVSVCGAATTPEWGFGFRAYPFAGVMPRRMCVRAYGAPALEATRQMRALWKGEHPIPRMHTWLLTACRMSFSRDVPFQIGGDRIGLRSEISYSVASEQVDMLDWRALQ